MKLTQADREMVAEMQELLEQESRKSADKRDYDLIAQLAAAIHEATSADDLSEATEKSITQISIHSAENSRNLHRNRWIRPAVSIAACALLCIGANAWTLHVWGMNAFGLLYNIIPDGITFHPNDLENSQEISLDTTIDDPYGIKEKCEEYGFSPLTPSYIPEDLKLLNLSEHDGTDVKSLSFIYHNKKRSVSLNYDAVKNQDMYNDATIGFPSDEYNIHTETISDIKVIISWEDHIFRAEFCDNQIVYDIFCKNLEYDTAYHILVSYFI